MINLKALIAEKKERGEKIGRDAFIYLDPKGDKSKFAQCATCRLWTGTGCLILGSKTKVTADMTCNLYVNGEPQKDKAGKEEALMTPEEAGLVTRQVRCENCRSFKDGVCLLYRTLNKSHPELFDLDERVNEKGCCNAQKPKE